MIQTSKHIFLVGGERGGQRLRDGPRGRGRGGAGRGGKDHDRHFNRTGQRYIQCSLMMQWINR